MKRQTSTTRIHTLAITSTQCFENVNSGSRKRTQLIITNTSAAAVATIAKGDIVAVAGSGIILQPKQSYLESTDGGFTCLQDVIQCIGDVAGTLAISESFEDIIE